MKKQIEQLLSGKFKYDQPRLLFSKDKLSITLEAGKTARGELYLGTEDNDKIKGYITSSNRRLVPGSSRFSGTTVCLPYGADGTGMQPGEVCTGWLCVTSSIGEYKIPFSIEARQNEEQNFLEEIKDIETFKKTAAEDFKTAYHLFKKPSFAAVMAKADKKQKALYAGLSATSSNYQNLEEFLIGLGEKDPVSVSLKTTAADFFGLRESIQESFDIHKTGWGYLRLEIESTVDFLEPERHVITQDEFIGSSCRINYVIHAEKLKKGNQFGEIIVKSPYQELVYHVTASRGARIRIDLNTEEKRRKAGLVHAYIDYCEEKTDFKTWAEKSHRILERLHESGNEYPEYRLFEAYLAYLEDNQSLAKEILKNYQSKEFTRDELEEAGTYLYLCTLVGLYRDKGQALQKIQNFFRQKSDSFQLLWILLQLDPTYQKSPSMALFMMEELYEKGCTSPILYLEAWNWISKDISNLHRLSPFWMQVFHYAGRKGFLTEELVMRLAYLSGYEKKFYGCLYKALAAGYEKFPSDDVLEAICKYVMKGDPRKPAYFRWFSLAVQRGLRITRLYEYYMETMDISYRRQLPKPLLMYFAYNDNSLGDSRKAYVYASVITYKDNDPQTYGNYKETMERFAQRKAADGQIDENYAVLYQEFLLGPKQKEDADKISGKLFTNRLYCDDRKIREVIVCHSQLATQEVYPCVQGVAYPRIYTEDAVLLFRDDKQRCYASTVHYNIKKLMNECDALERILKCGVDDTGVLLHYCESHELNGENLEYFQKLAEAEECTEEYRNSVRKQILDFYAGHVNGADLDSYLSRLDYRKYIKADRKVLLEVLISRRMFRQAMSIVEEFGYEGIELGSLLKLTSRMILKSDMAEDDELLALASEVYREGKYDEVILHYLMLYRFGPVGELISIWKSARGFEMDTYDLEERILELLIFTADYRKEGEAVLESYVNQSGRERLIGAYLTQVAYGVFVKEYTMSPFIRSRLEYAYMNGWPLNQVCRLALLQEISREKDPKPEYVGMEQKILEECARDNLVFGFFRRLSPELLSPYQLDDKTFVECHAHPGARVTLFYALDTGLGKELEYKCEPLREIYEGIFGRTFTLFYGENLHYYFQIDRERSTRTTAERVLNMKKIEGISGSKYQLLNQMLSDRRLDKKKEVKDGLKSYLRQEQYVKEMFTIDKENGK